MLYFLQTSVSRIGIAVLMFGLSAIAQVATQPQSSNISDLLNRAQTGDVSAQRSLAIAYDRGDGVSQDYAEALKWYLKAAARDDAAAENNLGVMYRLGNGVPKDLEMAVTWYSRAAKQEFPAALMNLGIAYYNGEGVGEDPAQAFAWLSLSAAQGYDPAKEALLRIKNEVSECEVLKGWFALGAAYETGELLPINRGKAFQWYGKAAEHNDSIAQLRLSELLQASDPDTANRWRERAIKQNFGPAMYELGLMYENGKGVDRDPKLAIRWYSKALGAADPRGAEALGRLYSKGEGVNRDNARAYAYFVAAAKSGVQGALDQASALAKTMSDSEKQQVKKIRDIPAGLRPEPPERCSYRRGSAPLP